MEQVSENVFEIGVLIMCKEIKVFTTIKTGHLTIYAQTST